ncbi:MAG: oxygenase MpaB family protein [Gaiellaceae bacterium]
MARSPYLAEILRLDPLRDHKRIVHLHVCYEFPFDTTRSLEFALFRTFAVPTIAKLLDSTGEFAGRAQKRYDDTDILISAMLEHGYDSEVGTRALRRMNQIHGRFEIANDDFRYVLSTFVFEPIRWNARFGWRPMTENEKLALFHCWREIAHRMAIEEIPEDFAEFERFNVEYERDRFQSTAAGRRVAGATRAMFLAWFPGLPGRLGEQVIAAMLDDPILDAFGFRHPSPQLRRAVAAAMRARSRGIRLLPSRRRPRLRTEMRRRTYGRSYELESLGPPPPGRS